MEYLTGNTTESCLDDETVQSTGNPLIQEKWWVVLSSFDVITVSLYLMDIWRHREPGAPSIFK